MAPTRCSVHITRRAQKKLRKIGQITIYEVHDLDSISVVVACYAVSVAVQTKPGKRVLDNSDDTDDTAA